MSAEPNWERPSMSTDPTPGRHERAVDGVLRAAANLAPVVIPAAIGEELRMLFWIYYNTDDAERFRSLAQSVVDARPSREG